MALSYLIHGQKPVVINLLRTHGPVQKEVHKQARSHFVLKH